MNELEEIKKTIDARAAEKDEVNKALQSHQANAAVMREQIEDLEQQVQDLTDEAQANSARSVE